MHLRTLLRMLVAFISAVATYYYASFIFGGLLVSAHLVTFRSYTSLWLYFLVSMLVAVAVARYTWRRTESAPIGLGSSVLLGALVAGGIAFSAGFFGPILLTPHANQGPLLGILFTGPLGYILGAVGGAIYWWARRRRASGAVDGGAA
jgi:hypothetical protein